MQDTKTYVRFNMLMDEFVKVTKSLLHYLVAVDECNGRENPVNALHRAQRFAITTMSNATRAMFLSCVFSICCLSYKQVINGEVRSPSFLHSNVIMNENMRTFSTKQSL